MKKTFSSTEHALINKLHDQEHFIEQILNNSPDIVYVLDIKGGKITYANKKVAEVMGAENMNLDKIHPMDYDLRKRHVSYCSQLKKDETKDLEVRMMVKNGYWNWFGIRETAFKFDTLGKVSHLIGVARNIQDDKVWEMTLKKKDQLLQQVLSIRSIGMVAYKAIRNKAGNILDYEFVLTSKLFEEFHQRNDLTGKWVYEEFPETKKFEYEKWKHVVETGEPMHIEMKYPNSSGEIRWFDLKYEKFDDGLIILYDDITDRKNKEAQINKQKDVFNNITNLISEVLPKEGGKNETRKI